jgi:hypothetical protein
MRYLRFACALSPTSQTQDTFPHRRHLYLQ